MSVRSHPPTLVLDASATSVERFVFPIASWRELGKKSGGGLARRVTAANVAVSRLVCGRLPRHGAAE
jgi:hypothetical protein